MGNVALLLAERFATVHVRSTMVRTAEDGDDTPLRNYMNNCVLMARKGVVMVSPFISPQERRVMQVLLQEQPLDYNKIVTLTNELALQDPKGVRFSVDANIINRLGTELRCIIANPPIFTVPRIAIFTMFTSHHLLLSFLSTLQVIEV